MLEGLFNLLSRRKKSGVVVRTFVGAGAYQHSVWFWGKIDDVPPGVVELLKQANERLYEYMPVGSDELESRIGYEHPEIK